MKLIKKNEINVETSKTVILMLSYMLNPDLQIRYADLISIQYYMDKIIKIYERNCIKEV